LVVAAAFVWLRRNRILFFGFLFYLLSIVFVLQIVPVGGFAVAERYSYLSALGLALMAAEILFEIMKQKIFFLKTIGMTAVVLLAITGVILSAKRCFVWKNSITVWSDAIEKYPRTNAFAYNQRGAAHASKRQSQKALADFDKAVEFNPKYFDAYFNRGCVYYEMARYDEAVENCGQAIKLFPAYIKAYNMRGIAYGKLGEYDKSIGDLNRAIELSPFDPELYYNRATTLAQAKKYSEALNDFNKAIELNPGFGKAYFYRSYVYYLLGDRERAQQDVDKAKSLGFAR
jgi:tetratricopeptide (TPR) repeat protein